MTPEELDEARANEAQRRWASGQEVGSSSWVVAARLARENWTPPEPEVDPDTLAFREWVNSIGLCSYHVLLDAAYLAGARMAREQERERAKVPIRMAEELAGRFRHLRLSLPLGVRAQFGVKWDLDEALLNAVEAEIAKYEEGGR